MGRGQIDVPAGERIVEGVPLGEENGELPGAAMPPAGRKDAVAAEDQAAAAARDGDEAGKGGSMGSPERARRLGKDERPPTPRTQEGTRKRGGGEETASDDIDENRAWRFRYRARERPQAPARRRAAAA